MADAIRYGCITRRNCMENTSNYGLKRWDGEDRILHTEFNDNWDKIDTAIKGSADKAAAAETAAREAADTELGKRVGLQLIQTVNGTTGESCDFSVNIDWNQWAEVIFVVKPKFSAKTSYDIFFYKEDSTGALTTTLANSISGNCSFITYPLFDKTTSLNGFFLDGNVFEAYGNTFQNLGYLSLSPNSDATAKTGSLLKIYGKK